MKVLTVIGTRPEAIKLAPVVRELQAHKDAITSIVCATGQHRQMLDQVLTAFDIHPDYDLDVMESNQTLPQLTSKVLTGLDRVFAEARPDWLIVQGDTTTVMAASLGAFYARVRVGHVEAGLRTGDKWSPYPEEINRKLTDSLTDVFFAPTEASRQNLLREGVRESAIEVTGNTVVDALLQTVDRIKGDAAAAPASAAAASATDTRRVLLVTAHRRENFGAPMRSICHALAGIADQYRDQVRIVYPVHPNPNVRGPVHELLGGIGNIDLIEPLDYVELVRLMSRAYLILTDSGGLQEEAPSLKVPVLVMRDVTERPEGVAAGVVRLVGTDAGNIMHEVSALIDDDEIYRRMASGANPYGDGQASSRIVASLLQRNLNGKAC